jgi:hypothetical protein
MLILTPNPAFQTQLLSSFLSHPSPCKHHLWSVEWFLEFYRQRNRQCSPSCEMLTPIDFLWWEMLGRNPGIQCVRKILLTSLHVCSSTYRLIKHNAKDTSRCRFRIPADSTPQSSRQQTCNNRLFLSSPISLAGAVSLTIEKTSHAFAVEGVLRVSRTSVDSVEGRVSGPERRLGRWIVVQQLPTSENSFEL